MKKSISTFAVATLVAAFATTAAHASYATGSQGRVGYSVPTKNEQQTRTRSTTTVALTAETPKREATRVKNIGRAGFVIVPVTVNR